MCVADFGIARALEEPGLTQPGRVLGTGEYVSPEQALGRKVDARSDLYALGVVLYEMLAGRPPFRGSGFADVAARHVRDEPPPIGDLRPNLPTGLAALISALLAKAPEDRPQDAATVRTGLRQILQPLAGPDPSPLVAAALREDDDAEPATGEYDALDGGAPSHLGELAPWEDVTPSSMNFEHGGPIHLESVPYRVPASARENAGALRWAAVLALGVAVGGIALLLALTAPTTRRRRPPRRRRLRPPPPPRRRRSRPRRTRRRPQPTRPAQPLEVQTALTFDPPPGDGSENDDQAQQAIDGDAATFWETETYRSDPVLSKGGVGLVLALPQRAQVAAVELRTPAPGLHRRHLHLGARRAARLARRLGRRGTAARDHAHASSGSRSPSRRAPASSWCGSRASHRPRARASPPGSPRPSHSDRDVDWLYGCCRRRSRRPRARCAADARATRPRSQGRGAARHRRRDRRAAAAILEANRSDVEQGRADGLSTALLDRLTLDDARIAALADAARAIAALPDPCGEVDDGWRLANDLDVTRVRVPLGRVLVVYEARPNVTIDVAALCLKSGNVAILRGSRSANATNAALLEAVHEGLDASGLPRDAAIAIAASHDELASLVADARNADVVIPRGGEALKDFLLEHARIPVLAAAGGNCHVYVDASADPDMAERIAVNAKTHRPGVCNAAETLLVHADAAPAVLPRTARRAAPSRRRAARLRARRGRWPAPTPVAPADEDDYATEFLDLVLAVRVVDSLDDAIDHIGRYATGHSEAIVTESLAPPTGSRARSTRRAST